MATCQSSLYKLDNFQKERFWMKTSMPDLIWILHERFFPFNLYLAGGQQWNLKVFTVFLLFKTFLPAKYKTDP